MSTVPDLKAEEPSEWLHALSLGVAAVGLLMGLVAHRAEWVNGGISLVILLPPLRLATTILGEARRRRFGVAAMGLLVLAFLIFSRRIS